MSTFHHVKFPIVPMLVQHYRTLFDVHSEHIQRQCINSLVIETRETIYRPAQNLEYDITIMYVMCYYCFHISQKWKIKMKPKLQYN